MSIIYHIRKQFKKQEGSQYYKDRSDRGQGTYCGAKETDHDITWKDKAISWGNYIPCQKCIIIKILLDAGYRQIGKTQKKVYRIVTVQSYPLPGAEIVTGGRLRFEKPPYRVTVGKHTVCLYEMVNGEATNFQNIKTKKFSKEDIEKKYNKP